MNTEERNVYGLVVELEAGYDGFLRIAGDLQRFAMRIQTLSFCPTEYGSLLTLILLNNPILDGQSLVHRIARHPCVKSVRPVDVKTNEPDGPQGWCVSRPDAQKEAIRRE
ncbi:hypothetical protein ACVIKP_000016 [Rhizobium leguminosarum]